MLLENKTAVIYGAGGGIGSAVTRAFAREGARLFLTGRHRAPVEAVAKEVNSAGGSAEAAEVDALDDQVVDKHLQSVIDKAGRVDISFNAVGIPNAKILGVPLIELDVEQFSLPIATYTRSYFLTARMAARRMVANKSGVIMTVTALHSRTGIPLVGGYGPAMAAKEHSLEIYPPSLHLRAFAWSVCDHRACRRHAQSRTPSSLGPRQRE
jgi:NAD(P)-dependent dehydrogenase (short-subunit alcohol dehydrogenase family)